LFGKCLSNHLVLQKKREARKREKKERVRKNLTVNGTWLHPQQRARPGPAMPGPAPDNVLLLSSPTAQSITGKQNKTGSYNLLADGAMSVSRSLTSLGFGTVLVVTTNTEA
jgi:hypothetical protein